MGERIAQQTVPAQVRILESYGQKQPGLKRLALDLDGKLQTKFSVSELKHLVSAAGGHTDNCLEKADLVKRLRDTCGTEATVLSIWASNRSGTGPLCVCGDRFTFMLKKDRARAFLRRERPDLRDETSPEFLFVLSQLERAMGGIICDLCEETDVANAGVWTCNRGSDTILHATSYDVCASCFAQHTCGSKHLRIASA